MTERSTDPLTRLLEERGVLLADGAMGTSLFDRGLESGEAPELWCDSHPDRVAALHRAFVEAGADIIQTNSFGGTRHRLKLHGADGDVHRLNRLAAEIARKEADGSDRIVLVAGSVGPTGELLEPLGELTRAGAVEAFIEQMEGLCEGGADLLWIETMSAADEIGAAIEASRAVGLPAIVTASFDTAGRTMMGIAPSDLGTVTDGAVAVGANCGVGASDILATLLAMDDPRPLVVKGNCGIPKFRGTEIHYSGTVEQMADYSRLAVDAGASIIGGCCGTTPEHLSAMRVSLDHHTRAERPDVEAITERIGPLVNALPTASDGVSRRRGRRRAP